MGALTIPTDVLTVILLASTVSASQNAGMLHTYWCIAFIWSLALRVVLGLWLACEERKIPNLSKEAKRAAEYFITLLWGIPLHCAVITVLRIQTQFFQFTSVGSHPSTALYGKGELVLCSVPTAYDQKMEYWFTYNMMRLISWLTCPVYSDHSCNMAQTCFWHNPFLRVHCQKKKRLVCNFG